MAKQYKKLQQKIHPQKKQDNKKNEKPVGKDYLLIGVIVFITVVTMVGWSYLDGMNRAMYIFLDISMILTYVRRHAKLSETQGILVERGSLVCIGFAMALFAASLYYTFTNS